MIKTTYEIWVGKLEVIGKYMLDEVDKASEDTGKDIVFETMEKNITTINEAQDRLMKYAGDVDHFKIDGKTYTHFTFYEIYKVDKEFEDDASLEDDEINAEITSCGRV